eukprot:4737864-Karenia_brevis.AAC.1
MSNLKQFSQAMCQRSNAGKITLWRVVKALEARSLTLAEFRKHSRCVANSCKSKQRGYLSLRERYTVATRGAIVR